MSPNTEPESQLPTVFQEFTWVKGAKTPFESICVRIRADGRVDLGIKGYDKKQGGPGYISAGVPRESLDKIVAQLTKAQAAMPKEA